MCQRCKNTYAAGLTAGGSLADMERACANSKTKLAPDYLGVARMTGSRAALSAQPRSARTRDYEPTVDQWLTQKIRNMPERSAGEYWNRKPVVGLSDAGRRAELARQAKRLAKAA